MKIKQLFIAVIIVISACVTSCKKDESVTPQTHQTVKLATIPSDSTQLTGGDDDPKHPKG